MSLPAVYAITGLRPFSTKALEVSFTAHVDPLLKVSASFAALAQLLALNIMSAFGLGYEWIDVEAVNENMIDLAIADMQAGVTGLQVLTKVPELKSA